MRLSPAWRASGRPTSRPSTRSSPRSSPCPTSSRTGSSSSSPTGSRHRAMSDTATGLEIGAPAPVSPQMLGVDGRTHTLEELGDAKVQVVVFIGNGCPTVRAYGDRLKELHRTYEGRGVGFVAVNS